MPYFCENCNKWWSLPIKRCIFCGDKTKEINETDYEVLGFTKVFVPSEKHQKVPYFNYLLEDRNSNKLIIKSFNEYSIGDNINLEYSEKSKKMYTVGIIGSGQMGMGINELMLIQGHKTIIKTRKTSKDLLSKIISLYWFFLF